MAESLKAEYTPQRITAMANSSASSGKKCDICGGTGWYTYYGKEEELGETYLYAQRCTQCGKYDSSNDATGVPEVFTNCSYEKIRYDVYGDQSMDKYQELFISFVKDFKEWGGKGMYFFSKAPGSGKTYIACCLGKSAMMKNNVRFRFITAPDYFQKVIETNRDKTINLTKIYYECEILCLDDLGAQAKEKENGWQSQELFRLLNYRMNNNLTTIITSNESLDKLSIDEKVRDRIYAMCCIVPFPEVMVRRERAKNERKEFYDRILKGSSPS